MRETERWTVGEDPQLAEEDRCHSRTIGRKEEAAAALEEDTGMLFFFSRKAVNILGLLLCYVIL